MCNNLLISLLFMLTIFIYLHVYIECQKEFVKRKLWHMSGETSSKKGLFYVICRPLVDTFSTVSFPASKCCN